MAKNVLGAAVAAAFLIAGGATANQPGQIQEVVAPGVWKHPKDDCPWGQRSAQISEATGRHGQIEARGELGGGVFPGSVNASAAEGWSTGKTFEGPACLDLDPAARQLNDFRQRVSDYVHKPGGGAGARALRFLFQ
jgi:hypothetical protein